MATVSDEHIYDQTCQEFRSLNGFFWQIPLIMMTLNGGLWYSVGSLSLDVSAQRAILWFAVVANLVMIAGLWRLRSVMQSLLRRIHDMEGRQPKETSRIIQALFSILLALAAFGAAWASCDPGRHFSSAKDGNPACERAE